MVQGALLKELAHLLQVLDVQGGQGDADAVDLSEGKGREGGRGRGEGEWTELDLVNRYIQANARRLSLCCKLITLHIQLHELSTSNDTLSPLIPTILPPSLPPSLPAGHPQRGPWA